MLPIVVLAHAICTSALAQTSTEPATQFFNFVCEIDSTPVGGNYTTPDGTKSIFTFSSRRLCTGEASQRNVKLECSGTFPGWNQGSVSASSFPCTINGDTCGLEPLASDPNAPYLTATASTLTVDASGAAALTCFYKP
jgi:hypothetical protein